MFSPNGNSLKRFLKGAIVPAIAVILISSPTAANPMAAELNESFALTANGTQVNAGFLGIGDAEEYNDTTHVQWKTDDGWEDAPGSWSYEGKEDAESGSGVMAYNKMSMLVSCPAAGTQTIRLCFQEPDDPDDDAWGWGETDIECTAAGPDMGEGETTSCSVTRVGDAAPFAAVIAGLLGAFLLLRRRD